MKIWDSVYISDSWKSQFLSGLGMARWCPSDHQKLGLVIQDAIQKSEHLQTRLVSTIQLPDSPNVQWRCEYQASSVFKRVKRVVGY